MSNSFKNQIIAGIPNELPSIPQWNSEINHAPARPQVLNTSEIELALRNALRYFPARFHSTLAPEFAEEFKKFGRIYMYRFRPTYEMRARNISEYPGKIDEAKSIMMMIQNNLNPKVAQHPHELITYGGNGTVFQNWAQYLLTMKYLSQMDRNQTLVMYSGHPLGLFPSSPFAPRVVVTNGMVIPNYSSYADYDKLSALGVTSYGQMTAGSFMYIGSQGIVHGTTITLMNAGRKYLGLGDNADMGGKLYVTSGLGGMSGAQGKAGKIAGCVSVIAEINPLAATKRMEGGWVDELYDSLDELLPRIISAKENKEAVAIGYIGNIVDLWERLYTENISVELGSDQTSLHAPYTGGYYPAGLSFEQSNEMMVKDAAEFKKFVDLSLVRHMSAVREMSRRGMKFWDYGNAFLLQASKAGCDITDPQNGINFPSYVEDIMGPICFDYGFGPFRWVVTSCDPKELEITDKIAAEVIRDMLSDAEPEIRQQLQDNLQWIEAAQKNDLVVGSQARILYSNEEGRINIALAFNQAIRDGRISCPIVLGRDHHDVGGTDSPFRETANISDGSMFCADMAVQNFVGDSFRGATWISLHNGGGVGWGEVVNGGFGMVLMGDEDTESRIKSMTSWDVNNGIARRAWARNEGAVYAISKAMKRTPSLQITMPNFVPEDIDLRKLLEE